MLRGFYKKSPRLRRAAHRAKDVALFHAARAALWSIDRLSLPRALALADGLGRIAYLVLGDTRRLALRHLEMVFGAEKTGPERARIARASLCNVARCFCEVAKVESIRADYAGFVEVVGWENLAANCGRGAIVASAHLGNWELLAAYVAARLGSPVAAVARRLDEPRLNAFLVDYRTRNGVETILRESSAAPRQILNVLKRRGVLAVLVDQDTKAPSVTVPFLGHPARTPYAPAALALRRDLPILVAHAIRLPRGGLRFVFSPPLDHPDSGDRVADTIALTARVNQELSAAIRANPESWVWWHRRWRRKPLADLDMDGEIPYGNSASPRSSEVRE